MKAFWMIVLVIKAIVYALLLLVFLPFILLWIWIRSMLYRAALGRAMRKAGMPERFIKEVSNEMRIRELFALLK